MTKFIAILLIVLMQFTFIPPSKAYAFSNPSTVPLLTVQNFAALAHTNITSPTGPTVLNNGDMGIDAGACTGFPSPCTASGNGTLNGGSIHLNDAVALQGQTDATAAVTNIGGRTANQTLGANITGLTLTQGVYDVPAAATNLAGDLTLNGDANSIFIFHLTSTLITSSGSRVLLTGGAQACNVFWKVDSSATFNGTTQMVGTVFASASTSFVGGGATLDGRVIAQTAAITFNNTIVNNSTCASSTTSSTTSSSSSSSGGGSTFCPAVVATKPIIITSSRLSPTSISINWGPYQGTNLFIVQYGYANGNWLYSTNVTGFSATLNGLIPNQPIWVHVAARNSCSIGNYGDAMLVGGPSLPNTGLAPYNNNIPWYIPAGIFVAGIPVPLILIKRKYRFLSKS